MMEASVADAWSAVQGEDATYIDVRTEEEFRSQRVPGATNIVAFNRTAEGLAPNENFVQEVREAVGEGAKLFIGCRSGARSARACALLTESGFSDVTNVAGGIQAWLEAGLPVETGED